MLALEVVLALLWTFDLKCCVIQIVLSPAQIRGRTQTLEWCNWGHVRTETKFIDTDSPHMQIVNIDDALHLRQIFLQLLNVNRLWRGL